MPAENNPDKLSIDAILDGIADPIAKREALKQFLTTSLGVSSPSRGKVGRPRDTSKSPYYKENFAKEIQAVLDGMLQDRKGRIFRYATFSSLTPSTLYQKLNQSFSYLCDHMDPDLIYTKLRSELVIDRGAVGIVYKFPVVDLNAAESLAKADIISDDGETSSTSWRMELNKFILEGPVPSMFERKELNLTNEEVEDLEASFYGLIGVKALIKNSFIKVIKFVPEPEPEETETTPPQDPASNI